MSDELAEKLAELLKALANPVRLKILALCMVKERTSRELREKLGLSKPLLIAHLRKLLEQGLLEYRVVVDEETMVLRKLYRAPRDLEVRIDRKVLERIAREVERG